MVKTGKLIRNILLLAGSMFLSVAFGDSTVSMALTGVGNGTVVGPAYVNPYNGTVNNSPTLLICDDFAAESYVGETWKANAISFADLSANLSNTKWGSLGASINLYYEAAWLSDALLAAYAANDTVKQGQLSYAIWGLFTPSALQYSAGAQGWIDQAVAAVTASGFSAAQFNNYVIYTPIAGTAYLGTRAMSTPQEFIARTPEGSAIALLLFNLAGMLMFAFVFRRRIKGMSN